MFVILSCHLIHSNRLKHWQWKLFSFRSSFLVIFQVSQPYSRTGRTKVLNRRILVLLPIPLAAQTLLTLRNAPCTFYRRCIMSLLPPPSLPTVAPGYVNYSTSSTSSPSTTIFSLLLAHSVLSVLHFLALSLSPTLAASSPNLPVLSCRSLNLDDRVQCHLQNRGPALS